MRCQRVFALTAMQSHLAQYLASRYELAIEGTEGRPGGEPIVRGSRRVHEDGAVDLFGSVPEGARVHLVTATEDDLYEAAREAARSALANAGQGRSRTASGVVPVPVSAGRRRQLRRPR